MRCLIRGDGGDVLVFPAASSPSISRRISLDPKILFIILEIEAPIVAACVAVCYVEMCSEPSSRGVERLGKSGVLGWRKVQR